MRCHQHPEREAVVVPLWPANSVRGSWLDHDLGACPECAVPSATLGDFAWVEIGSEEFLAALPAARMEEVSNAALYRDPGDRCLAVGMCYAQLTG